MSDFNYINIFCDDVGESSKISGKDSYGNELYFPEYVECPINDIIITKDEHFDTKGEYFKLELKDNIFLYYTNKKIDKKIIINLINNHQNGFEFNFQESENKKEYIKFDTKSYFNVDFDYNNEIYLLGIHYIGIDYTILPKSEEKKIKYFENKLKIYNRLSIAITFLLSIYYTPSLILFIAGIVNSWSKFEYYLIIIFIALSPIIIITCISLSFNRYYVIDFIKKINETYENNRVNFSWEIMIIINLVIIIIFGILLIDYEINECSFCDCDCSECFKKIIMFKM